MSKSKNSTTKKLSKARLTSARSAGSRKNANTVSGSTVEAKPTTVSRDAVAEAAYFLWLQRGGNDVANWMEAEVMLQTQTTAR